MTSSWLLTPLHDILSRSEEWTSIEPGESYKQVTVRLWGKGVTQRAIVAGAQIAAEKQLVVRADQFILSRIDARNGAFGLVPGSLDGAVVSNDFPTFDLNKSLVLPEFMQWLSKTRTFIELCGAASEGTTNRVRLKEERFLNLNISLPSINEQLRIVARLNDLAKKIEEVQNIRQAVIADTQALLVTLYYKIIEGAKLLPVKEVAPLIRRPVEVQISEAYLELGIRSFGKGTFHKPPTSGAELGTKRIFRIEPEDLLFNIVFAWEGAVAVARPEDAGRVGSHRFLTCVARKDMALPSFLRFHFLTEHGLSQLGEASPGGAGRNRTLGLKALENIMVPVPAIEKQRWFNNIQIKTDLVGRLRTSFQMELDAILPALLDKAFKGEL